MSGTAARPRGWWRRNWWALVVVVPVFAGAVLLHPSQPYQAWRSAAPREAVTAGADEPVSFAGARMRLVALESPELVDGAGQPLALPPAVRAWQATVEVTALSDPEALAGCQFQLEDAQGRLFGNGPTELAGARGPDGELFVDGQCWPEEDGADGFETTIRFVLPAEAEPLALRVTTLEQRPGYARFEVG